MAFVFVLALLASSHPATHDPNEEAMRLPPFRVTGVAVSDLVAGAPGSGEYSFPDELKFADDCEGMETPSPLPDLDPLPTPTPPIYPPEGDIAWDIARVAAAICQINGCNVSRNASFDFAVAAWRALPAVKVQENTCPEFFRRNPLFPETPEPTPVPLDLNAREQQQMEKLEAAMRQATHMGDDDTKMDLLRELQKVKTAALDRITEKEEIELAPPPVMAPMPIISTDCGDDVAGTSGLDNDDVADTGSAMNHGYRPFPIIYKPHTSESLEYRERIIEARPASSNDLLMNMMQTEEGLTSNECTVYAAMGLDTTIEPSTKQHADLRAECQESCLFDDDCTAWMWSAPKSRDSQNCLMFSLTSPKLVEKEGITVGLCPKSKMCPKSTLNLILDATHSKAARDLQCPELLATIMDGKRVDRSASCPCIKHLKSVWATPSTGDDCVISPESLPWADVLNLCNGVNLVQVNMIQHHLRDCSGTSLFSANVGGCATYAPDFLRSNFLHCSTDFDAKLQKFAKDACPECGKCEATPTPTPYIPPPSIMRSFTLPNGDSTPCLDAMKSASEGLETGPLMGSYVPKCFQDGSFMPTQCAGDFCWCVTEVGLEIDGTRYRIGEKDSADLSKCRPEPEMGLIYPPVYEIKADSQLVAIRSLSKLMYMWTNPELFCRPGVNRTLEWMIQTTIRTRVPLHNREKPSCPFTKSNSVPFSEYLALLAKYLVPPPVRLFSPSPSNSPTPSVSPSVSVSPSASPSAPVPMCGDVTCSELGIAVHMYKQVPQGYCRVCKEGTSGPCRDTRDFACYDYMYGDMCHHTQLKCADLGEDNKDAKPLCKDREEDHTELRSILSIPLIPSADSLTIAWNPMISSALADVLGVSNLCDISVRVSPEDSEHIATLTVNVARVDNDKSNEDLATLSASVSNGSLIQALDRRGVPVDSGRGIIMRTASVATVVAMKKHP